MIYRYERLKRGSVTVPQTTFLLARCSKDDMELMNTMYDNDSPKGKSTTEWFLWCRYEWLNEKVIPLYCPVKGEVVVVKDDWCYDLCTEVRRLGYVNEPMNVVLYDICVVYHVWIDHCGA